MNYLYATTNIGCEQLLAFELNSLGAKNLNVTEGGVYYEGEDLLLYQSLIWSRVASRIFMCIKKFSIQNRKDLYVQAYHINWDEIIYLNKTFLINFKGNNNVIPNNSLGELTIQKAIFDQFYKKYSIAPNVNLINPDIKIYVISIYNTINIMLDLSGDSLDKRGYGKFINNKSIKENLSAAIVLSSSWKKNYPLIDPICGLGTLLIEAAMIYSDRAPGLKRKKWGFQYWKGYNKVLWYKVVDHANMRFEKKIKKCSKNLFIGYYNNNAVIEQARIHAFYANISDIIHFSKCNLNHLNNPYKKTENGTLLTNPIREKYNTENTLVALYIQMSFVFKKHFQNWKLSIYTSSKFLLNFLQMQSYEKFFFKNNLLDGYLNNYKIFSETIFERDEEYINRLKKNIKKLKKWNDFSQIQCFRIYDRDIPNYQITVDIYKKWLVIQEYQTNTTINKHDYYKKICHAIYYTKEILSISINNIIFKIRKKQKNNFQYSKLHDSNQFFIIYEYNAKLLVNLIDYLDTGLFLEHRCTRKLISNMAYDKDFLNLFSYTGSATVYAGLGGAKTTTNVDISNTYIKWSIKNMSINNLKGNQHYFIKANCLDWINSNYQKFDLIFINPPAFSNSKKMKKVFDLKKDYLSLISSVKKNLKKHGYIIFSSSTKNFKINFNEINKIKLYAKDITNVVQSKDFLNKKYYSWLIKHI